MQKNILLLVIFTFFNSSVFAKESSSKLCYKRGFEIILPYEFGIKKIKKQSDIKSNFLRKKLRNYKENFEKNFYGLYLYKAAGCSKSRLSEYLNCLVETDGKDCKIYYSQMRIVD